MRKIHPLAFLPVSAGFLVLVLSLMLTVWKISNPLSDSQNLSTQAADVKGTLSLYPQNQVIAFDPKTTFPVGIIVHSSPRKVIGSDILIRFDPKIVSVDSVVSFTSLFEKNPVAKVDNISGTILVGVLNFQPKISDGLVATFKFKTKTVGNARFTIDFVPGSRSDSNVVDSNQEDILANVENASYVIK